MLLAVGGNERLPDYDYTEGLELHLYALADGAEAACEITDLSGQIVMKAKAARRGNVISFETDCPEKEPTLVIHGMEGGVQGGKRREGSAETARGADAWRNELCKLIGCRRTF